LKSVRRAASIVIGVGIALRAGLALFGPEIPFPDAVHYRAIAESIANGAGYGEPSSGPTAYWVPLYAVMLGAARWMGGEIGMRVLELLLSIATIAMAGLFARRAYGRTAGLVAGAIVAMLPSFILLSGAHLSENLGIPILLDAIVLAIVYARRPWIGDAVIGTASGVAILTREACAAVLPAAAYVVFTARRNAASVAVVIAVSAAVVAPWIARNESAVGVATLSTSSGDNLCVGLGEGATGGWRRAFDDGGRPAAPAREAERHRAGLACAGAGLRSNPLTVVALMPAKLTRLFVWDDWLTDDLARGRIALAALCNLGWWCVVLLAIVGARRGTMRPLPRAAFAATFAGTILVVIATFGNGRFHAPLLAMMAAPAARGLLSFGARR
jgi:4-amino-4-deoxy-L-arabinose transferase-like glycosyltransferase